MGRPLSKRFFNRPATQVAPDLLGMHLVRHHEGVRQVGRIVEVEAYQGPEDLAAHSAGGRRTARTEILFGPPGYAYVYLIYGMYHCFNVTTAGVGVPHAVLVRAVEPVAHIRGRTRGPGLLCRAMHIDKTLNAHDLKAGLLRIEQPSSLLRPRIATSARIGVDYAGQWAQTPWRYVDQDSPYLSR